MIILCKITRKDALNNAIAIVSEKIDDNFEIEETVRILKELRDSLPLVHWTEETIFDSVNQFIKDNGRFPLCCEFDTNTKLPSDSVIKRMFQMKTSEWIKKFYPDYSERNSFESRKERYTQLFIEEYNRIRPKTQAEYDRQRRKNAPSYENMLKYYGLTSRLELLQVLNLPLYSSKPSISDVRVHIDYDFKE